MTIDTTKLIFGYRLITQTLEDGRIVPGIESCNFDFDDFDKHDLKFEVHGSFWDGFINMFKGLFEGKIVDAIKGLVEKELTETLPKDINKLLVKTDGKAMLPLGEHTNWWFDFMTPEVGIITDTSIELGARGIIYDNDFNETLPESFPTMPYKDPAIPSELQAFISEESVNSLLTSFLQVTDVKGWFNASEVPEDAKFNLTTGALDKAFKGMKKYYGKDAPVDV